MTEVNPCGFLQNAGSTHTAEQLRSYLGSLLALAGGAASLKAASGIHPALGGQLAVTQNGSPNMSVNVAAGACFIQGTEGTKQGTYFCQNDATVNKTITAADPTNPRIDLVVAKVQDSFYSGATNAWSLAVVTGTPAGSPSPPTAPADSIILAQVAVAANATSIVTANITDKRTYNAALGGSVLCTSAARPSPTYAGLFGFETDTGRPIYNDGTNWRHHIGYAICTSTTRPASPFTGMRIYETDTLFWYTYNGTSWLRDEQLIYLNANQNFTNTTSAVPLTSGNTTPNGGFQIAMEASHAYWADLHIMAQSTGGANLGFDVTFPSGGRVDISWIGMNSTGVYLDGGIANWTSGAGTAIFGAPGSPGVGVTIVRCLIQCGGTPGNFVCQFAQGIANASPTVLILGSSFRYKQVS